MFWTPSGAFCEAITWCRTVWDLCPAAPSCLFPLSIYFFSSFTYTHSTTRNGTPTLQEFIWTALFVIGPPGPLLLSQYHFTVIASPEALMWEEEEQQQEKQHWRIRLILQHLCWVKPEAAQNLRSNITTVLLLGDDNEKNNTMMSVQKEKNYIESLTFKPQLLLLVVYSGFLMFRPNYQHNTNIILNK